MNFGLFTLDACFISKPELLVLAFSAEKEVRDSENRVPASGFASKLKNDEVDVVVLVVRCSFLVDSYATLLLGWSKYKRRNV